MPPRPWSAATDPFIFSIERSREDASDIGQHTADVLAAEAAGSLAIEALSADFTTVNNAWQARYGTTPARLGQQKAATGTVHGIEDSLVAKVNAWDLAIQSAGFIKSSPLYLSFFPSGHRPFTEGSRPARIAALTSLALVLNDYPSLAATRAQVASALTALQAASAAQTGSIDASAALSVNIDAANILLSQGLVRVLGGLMQLFSTDLSNINRFFAVEVIRRRRQTHFTGATHTGGEPVFIAERTLPADAVLTLGNDGPTNLLYFFFNVKNGGIPPGSITHLVAPGAVLTITAGEMGASATNKYLMVMDDNPLVEGHYVVDL